jgi:dTDP-4-dehydrorhamnose reductase
VYHSETTNSPLRETEDPLPKSVYARTKFNGDVGLAMTLQSAVIVRTSWVYSSFGTNFVKTMLRLGREKQNLKVVIDQIGTPTYARDLAEALMTIATQLAESPEHDFGGIYHYSNEGVTSWYDFAKAIHRIAGISTCEVLPIRSSDYPTPAKRPPFSLLDKTKVKNTFGLTIRHWETALVDCILRLE